MNKQYLMFSVALMLSTGAPAFADYTLTTLASFNGLNGELPSGTLVRDASGNLYGTAQLGGANYGGTVFELSAGTHALTAVASFAVAADPYAGLIAGPDGNLYGTTEFGTVFKFDANTHALSTLAALNQPTFGGLLADARGNLYGTTEGGGANSAGTVFEVDMRFTPSPHSIIPTGSLPTPDCSPMPTEICMGRRLMAVPRIIWALYSKLRPARMRFPL